MVSNKDFQKSELINIIELQTRWRRTFLVWIKLKQNKSVFLSRIFIHLFFLWGIFIQCKHKTKQRKNKTKSKSKTKNIQMYAQISFKLFTHSPVQLWHWLNWDLRINSVSASDLTCMWLSAIPSYSQRIMVLHTSYPLKRTNEEKKTYRIFLFCTHFQTKTYWKILYFVVSWYLVQGDEWTVTGETISIW